MKNIIMKLGNFAIYGYIAFAVIVWVLNYFEIDISGILATFNVPADFFGATGLVAGAGKTLQVSLRWVLTKFETRNAALYGTFLTAVSGMTILLESVVKQEKYNGTKLEQAVKLNNQITSFMLILAEKNKTSKILDDDVKLQIELWQEEVARLLGDYNETL